MSVTPAFDEIYSTFHQKILHYLSNLLGEDEAEDLAQIVFLKVNEGLKDFRGESKISTWIYRIATNIAISKTRSPSFRESIPMDLESEDLADAEITSIWTDEKVPSADQALVRHEMSTCIRSIVEQLPENYRAVIVLSEYEGLKNSEISEILDISLDMVKIRIHRARKKLKKALECQCDLYRDERNELACDPKGCS